MDEKKIKRALKLLEIMDAARGRQVSNIIKSERSGDTLTGRRHYATYERQHDVYNKASEELAKIINAGKAP